jgi:hypothetical protein
MKKSYKLWPVPDLLMWTRAGVFPLGGLDAWWLVIQWEWSRFAGVGNVENVGVSIPKGRATGRIKCINYD